MPYIHFSLVLKNKHCVLLEVQIEATSFVFSVKYEVKRKMKSTKITSRLLWANERNTILLRFTTEVQETLPLYVFEASTRNERGPEKPEETLTTLKHNICTFRLIFCNCVEMGNRRANAPGVLLPAEAS